MTWQKSRTASKTIFSVIWNKHTLHLAAQLLNGLGSGLIIVWQLLPSGNRVGAGPVRQAALRGTLVPGSLLLPVQVVLHQELQLLGGVQLKKEKRDRGKNQGLKTFKALSGGRKMGTGARRERRGKSGGKGWKSLGNLRENQDGGEGRVV